MGDSIKENGFQWSQLFTYIAAGVTVVSAGIQTFVAMAIGGIKMLYAGLSAGFSAMVFGLKLSLAAFLSPVESAINAVITGIRHIQSIMGKAQSDFVSFATDMGKEAVQGIAGSFSD